LALTKVFKDTVCTPTVRIPMLLTGFTRNNYNESMICWGDNSTLLLPFKPSVNILAPVINSTTFKIPRHDSAPRLRSLKRNAEYYQVPFYERAAA
jgi:hypothetical protein